MAQLQNRRAFVVIRKVAALSFGLAAVGVVTVGAGGWFGGPTDALPPVPFPVENQFSEAKRVLGKILFWDEQLSSDNTVACATCHQSEFGGTDPRRVRHPGVDQVVNSPDDVFGSPGLIRQTAAGAGGTGDNYERDVSFNLAPRVTNRSAQGVINSAYTPLSFWDGRASGTFVDPQNGQVAIANGGALESQAVGPPVNDVEMAHAGRDWTQIAAKLSSAIPLALGTNLPPDVQAVIASQRTYPALFAAAFGDGAINARRIAFAIATYERTLIADQTDWDALQAGNPNALTPQENRGLQLFQGRSCAICHTPPLFSNTVVGTPVGAMFRNIGLRPPGDDAGRRIVTNIPGDDRRFKVPSLRNAGLKTSFTHTGQFTTLEQIVGFYPNGAAQFPQNRDPLIPIPLAPPEQADIVAFIRGALTDPRVAGAQFPFDRPVLYSGRPNTNVSVAGTGQAGTQNIVPAWIANAPPNVGNMGFKVGMRLGLSGAEARLRISQSPPVNNIVNPDQVIGPIQLADGGPQERGYATGHWPIAAVPAMDGRVVFMQWVIDDPGAPGGQSWTPPLRVQIFCGTTGCACYANCDQSIGGTTLTANDFACFLNRYASQDPAANCDGSTGTPLLSANDFTCFLNAYASGCP